MPGIESDDGWKEWRQYVLKKLDELSATQTAMARTIASMQAELSSLKTKAGMWGAVGAAIPTIAGAIFFLATK